MDVLCDTLMVEEILPRLPPKDLLRLGAASRRYNALVLDPDFTARYWRRPRAGVFFQPRLFSTEPLPRFLSGGHEPATELVSGADLSFLPGPSAREKEYLRRIEARDTGRVAVVLHSTAGLLLCSRGSVRPMHFYVCNPVTWQWVALPELPRPPAVWIYGLLRVDTDEGGVAKRFQVIVFNHPMQWQHEGAGFDLRLFSSDTGRWEAMPFQPPLVVEDAIVPPAVLGLSGTAYWIRRQFMDTAIAYNCANHSVQIIPLPKCIFDGAFKRTIGERPGGVLRYAHANSSVFEVWDSKEGGRNIVMWMLVHRVGVAELLEQNPEAHALFCDETPTTRGDYPAPIGFHPTDEDIVFVNMPGSIFAYSMEHGTMNLQCTHDAYSRPPYMFPYVHPPHLVQIPAIKNSIP
ncbi:hypothetical protein QOZ80_1AG0021680 [Eleusine coracana subsp. coracana]|nr:hypothetical protein QOZ80_1AG0021680 [Eleusine coracana subsp. coracana]